jgi:hypothetical protein
LRAWGVAEQRRLAARPEAEAAVLRAWRVPEQRRPTPPSSARRRRRLPCAPPSPPRGDGARSCTMLVFFLASGRSSDDEESSQRRQTMAGLGSGGSTRAERLVTGAGGRQGPARERMKEARHPPDPTGFCVGWEERHFPVRSPRHRCKGDSFIRRRRIKAPVQMV